MEAKQHPTKNQWSNDEIKEEIKQYLETNDSENTTIQNLWDATKAVLRGKFIVIQPFLKNKKRKKRKISNKHPNLPLTRIRKRTNKT